MSFPIRLFFYACLLVPALSQSQNVLKIKVVDASNQEVLPGANVLVNKTEMGGSTGANGIAELKNLPSGDLEFKVSFIGYRDTLLTISIPYVKEMITIGLHATEEQLDEIVVSSTRTNSRIEDLPLKVEVLGLEEMDEESTLVPGNVSSILGDLAVITIQRTNPVNGNDAIRMQGLDPQYTLLVKDGLPLYGGFSGSLGVLSIPPLDLKQVEIIKGSVSTLYGGSAISGMINFISREPGVKPHRTILLNYTTLNEKNINTFFSGKVNSKVGYTFFAGANLKSPVDVNGDGFSEVPENKDYIFHPRLFFKIGNQAKLNVGFTSTIDNRRSGDIKAVEQHATTQHPYLRTEDSWRNVVDIQFVDDLSKAHSLTIKTALSSYQRALHYPYRGISFKGKAVQYSSYTEINDRMQYGKHTVVAGINVTTESFRKQSGETWSLKDYDYVTYGIFAQDDWNLSKKIILETGLRYDYHNINGSFVLPRIALFYRATEKLSFRLASGVGYKAPNILAVADPNPTLINNGADVKSEHSVGVNADINYKTIAWGDVEISLNQAFYFAEIQNPIRVVTDTLNNLTNLSTQPYTVSTVGTDTYMQLAYKAIEIYLGYNHTIALQKYSSKNVFMPFNPKDKFSTTIAYSVEGKWRIGMEAAFTANQYTYGSQYYYNNQAIYSTHRVPNFWFLAGMIERKFPFGSIVLNVENITDSRQAKYEKLVTGTVTAPTFKPVWAPLDGRVFNLSVKVNL